MVSRAIEAETADWIDAHGHLHDENGRRRVVRNGDHPERTITLAWDRSPSRSLGSSTVGLYRCPWSLRRPGGSSRVPPSRPHL
jgi:hypothetical protein